MDIFDKQDPYLASPKSKFCSPEAFLVFCVVLALHGGLLYAFLNLKFNGLVPQAPPANIVEFRLLPTEKRSVVLVPVDPSSATDIRIKFVMPEFEVEKKSADNPVVYQLPSTQSKQFDHIFDPRLRKKLEENKRQPSGAASKRLDSFNNTHGTTVVSIGDGRCMVSMPSADKRERATNWGRSSDSCGRTNSQKMLDAVEEEMDAKKHPLKPEQGD